MKAAFVVAFVVGAAMAAVIPARGISDLPMARDNLPPKQALTIRDSIAVDSDEAIVYPAQVDQSWVDAQKRSQDSDEAVVYPAQVDQSWVDAQKRSSQDSDEAVVYPAQVDQSWVDAQ
ncbi:hypothetical protein ISF_09178 [Cordyceps fumosorosea ARSEF 2679]|uniref:Uncharacterized protein n=1 Tax=Cordyceps fumosorosea (strain ARSEF 2679) TaxID=1081104 RepID=A0A162M9G8_CORFA|nr:hypothetical protein ISF_09178 [Cordyceps fumosorosea ARSEF 2679]OAA52900.1 hypothetical protein ISF_09178 [Cordyceps fumosorosea ARSEF 2679]